MDDTQMSRAANAAATRKRRSSILKSQRPPRTPFSELEFSVATPTDSAKSRRVSFSKRKGVAEFVTNEATTTWKNFYEEHNKSLESSGNESGSKQSIGHLGKRAFDQQFEEVEADFIGTLNTGPGINISSSLNNFEQQLASLECTNDIKLTAPLNNFEMSAFTNDQTKIFDEFAIPRGEVTDPININFSAVQHIGEADDLDEIQNDLKQNFGNAPFQRQDISEYIEVDLNMTNVVKNDDDMSITDTIHSPKVQDVSKSNKNNQDPTVDKENVAINPYAVPREADNFAINEGTDKVLVFDGKRLKIQAETVDKGNYPQTLLLNAQHKPPQRKTIVLNVNDDLPNFFDDFHISNSSGMMGVTSLIKQKSLVTEDMSITEPEIKRMVLYDNDLSNISVTQAVPSNIMPEERRRTILYEDNGNISVTQAVPTNIIAEKRRTIAFHDSNISITQALPANVIEPQNEKRKTVLFDDGNISMTQALPVNILPEKTAKRRTIVYEDNAGNPSITQAVPNILITEAKAEKRRTIVYEDDTGNISVTQAIPSNIIISENAIERRRTVVFESDSGNISVTQAVPSNLILQEHAKNSQANTDTQRTEGRRRTIVYENDTGDLSMTQAVPFQLIEGIATENLKTTETKEPHTNEASNKRRTIVFENDDANISMTQAVSLNKVMCAIRNEPKEFEKVIDMNETENVDNTAKRRTVVFENDEADISMTQALPANVIQSINFNEPNHITEPTNKHRTVVIKNDEDAVSMTQVVTDQLIPEIIETIHDVLKDSLNEALHNKEAGRSKRTIVFDKEEEVFDDNVSMTQVLPVNIIAEANDTESKSKDSNSEILDVSMTDVNECLKDGDMTIRKSHDPAPKLDSLITKPINPSDLSMFDKDSKIRDCKNSAIESSTKSVNQFIVYQAALTKRTEQGDKKRQEPIVNEDNKKESSSKIADADEELSSSSRDTNTNEIKATGSGDLQLEAQPQEIPTDEIQTEMAEQNQSEIRDDQPEASSHMSKSILNDLLDMSSAEAVDDKGLMVQAKDTGAEVTAVPAETSANDTLFYITRDGDDEAAIQTDEVPQTTEDSPLPLEYIKETDAVVDLENKLGILKDALNEEKSPKNRHYEKIISSDLDKSQKIREDKDSKSFRTANDTNDLLDMLSDLTDKTLTRKLDAHLEEDEEQSEPILVKGHLALENKSETEPEPRRFSFVPKRRSIVMNREDNLSMAGAALKSRPDFDDELDDTEHTVNDSPKDKSPKKSVRLSNEVVKTLHFDDSVSEVSIRSDTKITPLKKTAFGQNSYMQEHKRKVIPDYLKNVTDGIKELMDDLVKPNADVLPFDTAGIDKSVRKIPSTCSTQIQANLVTSSQIDVNAELYSNPDSVYDVNVNKISSVDMINDAVNRSMSRALKSPIKSTTTTRASNKSLDFKMDVSKPDVKIIVPSRPKENSPGRVLIFDHTNPLNNILLAPETFTEVHKYNPVNSTDTMCVSERSNSVQMSINEKDYELERVSTQYNVGSVLHAVQQSGDSTKIAESQSVVSNISKPMSIDQSTDAKQDVKDTEVNTLIAMKGNKELLEASSSLTLVDDALAHSTFDVDIDSRTTTSQVDMKSPVRVIYTVDRDDLLSVKMDSDFTSNDESDDKKTKKRIYSPTKRDKHKQCTISSLELTPKPTTKMQKLSDSPDGIKPIDVSHSAEKPAKDTEKKNRSPRKSKSKKPGTSITVQQLMTEYNVGPIDHEALDEQIKDVLRDPRSESSSAEPSQTPSQSDVQDCTSLDMVSSFTSSKNLREDVRSQSSKVSRMDWQPDLIDPLSSNNLSECDSSFNVVAKIDMLPFMGSHECEWESSGGDTWAFRLLHSRLRLIVRLAHRHDNATRTRVRADTPVRNVALEVLPHDTKNSLAVLCVRFAAETMRYFISRGCASAGDVPPLVKRCAACARLAARWGRAMSEARLSLAYCLTPDAALTLKVANIPLRCVWEVSMRLELVVGDAREAPWVRAGGVRVRRVLPAAGAAARPHLPRDWSHAHLPRDWSHAPATIWRIFKYLKNKTIPDDDLFTGL